MAKPKLDVLVEAMIEKKENQNAPIKLALALGGGAMAGAYGAGVIMAIVNAGFGLVFDVVVGVSTGAPTGGYFLSVRIEDGAAHNFHQTSVYAVEARSRGFFRRGFRLNIQWITEVFRGSTGKPIRFDRVAAHPSRYVIVVTDWQTGEAKYIEPASETEMFDAIAGACAIPLMAPPNTLRGELVTDSSTSDPLPIEWLMQLPETERPTHILVVSNASEKPPSPRMQNLEQFLIDSILRHRAPAHIRSNFSQRYHRFQTAVAKAEARTDVVVAFDWLPWSVRNLERNPSRIRKLTEAGYRKWFMILKSPREH